MTSRPSFVALWVLVAACDQGPAPERLSLSVLDDARIAGALEHDGTVVDFDARATTPGRATLRLTVDGVDIDARLDVRGVLDQDGHGAVLDARAKAALVALRDALNREHPFLVQGTLHGRFLARHADWLADAPTGYRVETQHVDVVDRLAQHTTNDDSIYNTCLVAGRWYTAYYDAGNGGSQYSWHRQANSGSCLGRCGAGCNIFDTDLMLDCFEHDTCVDYFGGSVLGENPNCGDEFNHAALEYVVTYGAWCP